MLVNDRCANCDRAIDGADQKFCPACGQPTPAHRIDWHFLAHELEHSGRGISSATTSRADARIRSSR
jgi:predicted amidophosphoribosyltransferase